MFCDQFASTSCVDLDERHHICLLLLDGELFLAPIKEQPMVCNDVHGGCDMLVNADGWSTE
jgi:hypothetical protein